VLLNIALHGMEQAAGVRYWKTGSNAGWTATGSPVLVRYADDLIALCHLRGRGAGGQGASRRVVGAQGPSLQ
jgi:RNA-directed DNA polymerase